MDTDKNVNEDGHMSENEIRDFLTTFKEQEQSEHNAIQEMIKHNYEGHSKEIGELKENIKELFNNTKEQGESIVELRVQQKSTQSELTEFKKSEKDYGKENDVKFNNITKQLDGLKNMHWKVLLAGISIIGIGFTILKLAMK